MHVAPKVASVWRSEVDPAHSAGCGLALTSQLREFWSLDQQSQPRLSNETQGMTGRITRAEDFERVLKTHSQARSPHFAVHHLASAPSRPKKAAIKAAGLKLSTDSALRLVSPVDDPVVQLLATQALKGVWLGMVLPKRHAKRAVTRTLLKRQIKAVMACQKHISAGLWVVRLRAPFDRKIYISAASEAMREAARNELTHVLMTAIQRCLAV